MSEQYFTRPNVQPVITNIGTTPEQRQMSTSEFKAKFDEMPEAIQQYIKETLLAELDAFKEEFMTHQTESAYYVEIIFRNTSLAGVQRVSLPFKAKCIFFTSFITDKTNHSDGQWSENEQLCRYLLSNNGVYRRYSGQVIAANDGVDYFRGSINNVTNDGFDINWEKSSGVIGGEMTVIVTALTHGGEAQ